MDVLASVFFVDVGQGTSQVILFKDSSIVVVDCGESSDALIRLLDNLSFDRIRAVILSHWHDDHICGAPAFLKKYIAKIDGFLVSQDRPACSVQTNLVYSHLNAESKNRTRFWIDQLQYTGRDDGLIRNVSDGTDEIRLRVVYPDFVENLDVQQQKDENQGSGVLVLECKDSRVLFPGDAGQMAFQAIVKRVGNGQPLQCDIVAAPHHCGKLAKSAGKMKGFANCYEWFYSSVVKAKYVVVSVGSGNTYGHPREDHLSAARTNGASLMCTQITPQCHTNYDQLAPSILLPVLPSACDTSQGVGCAATIQADMGPTGVEVHRFSEHQSAVDLRLGGGTPFCRR